jgi:hypothetical protein
VAIARQRGMETIDAEVTELRARWHLHPDADMSSSSTPSSSGSSWRTAASTG